MSARTDYGRVAIPAAEALARDGVIDFAVYLPRPADFSPVLYREAGKGLSPPDFGRLRTSGVPFVYVESAALARCESVLEIRLPALLRDAGISPRDKAKLVHQVGTAVARDLTRAPASPDGLGRASRLVEQVVAAVLSDPIVAGYLLETAGHERTTASHMFAVSALAIMLGAEVFGSDYFMLWTLGVGGMMHDVGKLSISPAVLSKRTPLTPEETQLIHQHPIESVRLLGDDPRVNAAVRQIILQHHEWVDGQGYPLGVRGEDLLPGSRILAIVDSFHAMIGRRPYRRPLTPRDANCVLHRLAGRQFDPDLLRCWSDLFERCWRPAESPFELGPAAYCEEIGSRNEHRAAARRQGLFPARSGRFKCDPSVSVRCVYAVRLNDATCAPYEFEATVHDVSRRGLCIYSSYPMYRGEILDIQVNYGANRGWLKGAVAWCRQHRRTTYKTGLRFIDRIPNNAHLDPSPAPR